MKVIFITSLFFLIVNQLPFSNQVNGQPILSFTETDYDFGPVATRRYEPHRYEFTNTGDQPLAILIVKSQPQIRVLAKKGFIAPGEEGFVEVYPDINILGPFEEKIEVISNASMDPILITVRGEIVSTQNCPTPLFPGSALLNAQNQERVIIVLNALTKERIPDVDIAIVYNQKQKINGETNRLGEFQKYMPNGNYKIDLAAKNYEPLNQELFLGQSPRKLIYELQPIIEEIAEVIPPSQSEKKPEPEFSDLPIEQFVPNNIVFLIDVSLSMKANNKLEDLKGSIGDLVEILRPVDKLSLITYASAPQVYLIAVPGDEKNKFMRIIKKLEPDGTTNGVRGLTKAYEIASENFIYNANNQIILATDGLFTSSRQKPEDLKKLIADYANNGIVLSIIGLGINDEGISNMKQMAEAGKGDYLPIKKSEELKNLLIDEIKNKSRKEIVKL